MGNRINVAWVVFAGAVVVGCGAPGADGDEPQGASEPVIVSTQSALGSCGCTDSSYFTFTVSDQTKNTGLANSEHVCWPTRIVTNFFDPYDEKLLTYPSSTGNWTVFGTGEVQCAPLCCFFSNGGSSDVRWVSNHTSAQSSFPNAPNDFTDLWEPDSMPILSGLKFWRSTGDQYLQVYFESPYNQLHAGTFTGPAGTTTTGYGLSLFVGTPHSGSTPKYREYSWTSVTGTSTHISSAAGICTFDIMDTKNSAPSGGVYARLFRSSGVWKSQAFGNTSASVRCLYFNQDQ